MLASSEFSSFQKMSMKAFFLGGGGETCLIFSYLGPSLYLTKSRKIKLKKFTTSLPFFTI